MAIYSWPIKNSHLRLGTEARWRLSRGSFNWIIRWWLSFDCGICKWETAKLTATLYLSLWVSRGCVHVYCWNVCISNVRYVIRILVEAPPISFFSVTMYIRKFCSKIEKYAIQGTPLSIGEKDSLFLKNEYIVFSKQCIEKLIHYLRLDCTPSKQSIYIFFNRNMEFILVFFNFNPLFNRGELTRGRLTSVL